MISLEQYYGESWEMCTSLFSVGHQIVVENGCKIKRSSDFHHEKVIATKGIIEAFYFKPNKKKAFKIFLEQERPARLFYSHGNSKGYWIEFTDPLDSDTITLLAKR